jgi:hypothetical protein
MTARTQLPLWVKQYLTREITGPCQFPTHFWDDVGRPFAANDCWVWKGRFHERDQAPRHGNFDCRRVTGLVLRLTCGNRRCINPDHVATVSRKSTVFKTYDDWLQSFKSENC